MTVSAMMLTGLLKASVATTSARSGQKSCASAMAERAAVDRTYMSSSIARWPSAESATAAQTLPARTHVGSGELSLWNCHEAHFGVALHLKQSVCQADCNMRKTAQQPLHRTSHLQFPAEDDVQRLAKRHQCRKRRCEGAAPEVAETHGRNAEKKPMVVAEKPSCLKYRLKNGTMNAVQVNVNK